jgi:hypothetical protein
MYSTWIHVVAFFQVVVMNCVQPVNWKYCYRIDQWLIPDLIYAWELKTGKVHPYQSEKDYLQSVQGTTLKQEE